MGYAIGYSLKVRKLEKELEKLEAIKSFLLNEFGDELRQTAKNQILQEEIDRLLPQAKKLVLKDEIPKIRARIQKQYENKFDALLLEHLKDFFKQFVPIREGAVAKLFLRFQRELGFDNCELKGRNGDCVCEKDGKQVTIEFEKKSKDFINHGHDKEKIDLIVCWKNNIVMRFPVPILELCKEVPKYFGKEGGGERKW